MKSPGSNLTRNFSGDFNNEWEVTFSYYPGLVPYISHIGMCRPKGCGFLGLGFRPFAKSVEFAESPTQK